MSIGTKILLLHHIKILNSFCFFRGSIIAALALRRELISGGSSKNSQSNLENMMASSSRDLSYFSSRSDTFPLEVDNNVALFDIDNLEVEEDIAENTLDSHLNANCLSEIESLLKVIEADIEVLDLEYAMLQSSDPAPADALIREYGSVY